MAGGLDESRISRSHLSIIIITGTQCVRRVSHVADGRCMRVIRENTRRAISTTRRYDETRETGGNGESLGRERKREREKGGRDGMKA